MKYLISAILAILANPVAVAVDLASTEPKIDWQVVNRFPVFKNDMHFAVLTGLRSFETPRGNGHVWIPGATAEQVMTSEQFYKRLREHLPISEQTAWNEDEGLYDASQLFRTTNSIVASSSIKGEDCSWEVRHTDTNALTDQKRGDCSQSPYLKLPNISANYELRLSTADGQPIANTPIRIKQKLVVALGDSFASGEGNPDHPAEFGTNLDRGLIHDWFIAHDNPAVLAREKQAAWWDRACHRSLLSWPAMAALKQAVNEPHSVIQFASFACSGAEIYDGLLVPQLEPPGYEYSKAIERIYIRKEPVHPSAKSEGEYRYRLRHSQLMALAHLLCDGKVSTQRVFHKKDKQRGVRSTQQPFYGEFDAPVCSSSYRTVERLMFMFGGNDTGFSRVVLQAVDPRNLEFQMKWVGSFINSGIAQRLNPVLPEDAYRLGITHIPELMSHVNHEFNRLKILPSNVVLGIYPDLIQDLPSRSAQVLRQCTLRTADGFAPLQILLGELAGHDGARFGLRTQKNGLLESIRDIYIGHLRDKQRQSASANGWRALETTPAFQGRDICAVSADCKGDRCPSGDRVRWAWSHVDRSLKDWDESYCVNERDKAPDKSSGSSPSQTIHFCGAAPWRKLSEFNPYDPSRLAGIRFATDVLLATANRERQAPHGPMHKQQFFFSQDGIYGLAHPTAHMHSRIADLIQP